MADTLPTVKIQDGHGGFIIINESDFDPKIHKRLSEKAEKAADDAAEVATAKVEKAEAKK